MLQEYTADIDAKLRASELASIEDYIAESGSLVALHDQVRVVVGWVWLGGCGGFVGVKM